VAARARQAGEVGQRIQGEIDLAGGTPQLVPPDLFEKVVGQVAGVNQADKGEVRVDA
jgi:hypothetical protein